MSISKSVSTEIKVHLLRQGRDQSELGTALGMSGAAISRRMSGETPWNLIELAETARFLKVSVRELLPSDTGIAA